MFSYNRTRQFLKKFKPFLHHSSLTKHFTSQKILKHKKKPTNKIPRKFKKSLKSQPEKPNAESRLYKHDIIKKVYNILKYSTWDSAQEQLQDFPIKWESYTITQVLKTHPPMEKAWLFFNWASGRKNFKHDQYTYTTMIDIFGEAGRISSMKFVFEQMKEKGVKVDVVTYTSLLHWMSNGGDFEGAVKLWEEMKKKGCRPTVVSYTAYMKILFDRGKVREGGDVYKEMIRSGVAPNCYTYTVLMEYLARSGKFNEALEIFYKMQEAGVQPDKATCNILIEICCEKGETKTIRKILQYMKENFLVLRYNIYQKALESFKISAESDTLLREVNRHFSEENKIPDEFDAKFTDTHNGLVLDSINKRDFIALDSLLKDMMERGVKLDMRVVSEVIEVNCNHQRESGAFSAFEYSIKMGINIGKPVFLGLIGLSIRTNSFQRVVSIFEEMAKQNVSLGNHLNSLVIYRLGCNRELDSCLRVFNLLPDEEKGISEFTAFISAYFSSGNFVKGIEVFETMKSRGFRVALGTYCVLIRGLEKCGRVRELEYYKKEKKMLENDRCNGEVSMEENICNLLFAGDFVVKFAR